MNEQVRTPLPDGPGVMDDKVRFAVELCHGTAGYYDRCPLPYPEAVTGDLIARAGVCGQGRLLDLACGTGQLAFPLRRWRLRRRYQSRVSLAKGVMIRT